MTKLSFGIWPISSMKTIWVYESNSTKKLGSRSNSECEFFYLKLSFDSFQDSNIILSCLKGKEFYPFGPQTCRREATGIMEEAACDLHAPK